MPKPSEYNMSEGALQVIMSGGEYPTPIMQILGSKRINAGGGDKERIRILLSDGKHTISFAMLTTQMNDKVGPNGVETFSVVQIDKYITSVINNSGRGDARVLLILNMHVIVPGSELGEKIGSPTPLNDTTAAKTNTVKPSTPSNGVSDSNGTSHATTSSFKPKISNNSSMDTSESLAGSMINPISSLTPYHNKWVIKARVTSKSPIRTWSNSKGEGKLFSFDLVDEGGEIRVTAFRDLVDKFYDYIQVDKVYCINRCQLKPANKQYSSLKNDYEMTLTNDSNVQECQDVDDSSIPQTRYDFVPIDAIAQTEVNAIVDVLGVAKNVGELQTLKAKTTGRELKKKEVVLIDQSQSAIALTLWGTEAETFENSDNPVLVIKGARVCEFGGGKTLSMGTSSHMKVNPDMKECFRLRSWYDKEGEHLDAKNLSARSGSGGFSSNWMTFKEVKDQKLGNSEKGDYFQVLGTILLMKSENIIYKACPTEECNKKLVDMENGMYRCEKCNREFPNFKYRLLASMNVGDHTGNTWISMFSSEVEKILGMTAAEVGTQMEQNNEEIANIVDRAHFKEFILRCRAKVETYNDEARLKTVAVKVEPVNYEEYNAFLIERIKQLTN